MALAASKKSKRERKFVNQMRSMGDVPWPARTHKYPPMLSDVAARRLDVGQCQRKVAETTVEKKVRLRKRKQTVDVLCGGRLIAKLGTLSKRRVYCESCRDRDRQRKIALRLAQQQRRFGVSSPQEQLREERRSVKMLQRFRRKGAR